MSGFKAVILAGGSGERFWPLSTPEKPKQFLNVFGAESLIRQSVTRLTGLVEPKDVYVITAANLVAATKRELPEVPSANIVGEPMRRDTGAAIALAAGLCRDGVMGVFSSDQLIADPKRFRTAVRKAITLAKRRPYLVTLGITPTYPATGFGYVDPQTARFVEKPDLAKAKRYLKQGFLWNAGMFIGQADTFRLAFAQHAPGLCPLFERDWSAPSVRRKLKSVYEALPKISFDYAIMEPASHCAAIPGESAGVAVVPGDFGWDDVGSYAAFDEYFPHDDRGNVREGACTVVESHDNICVARSARISLLGVSNLVVITTKDHVLVVDKARLAEMKKLSAK